MKTKTFIVKSIQILSIVFLLGMLYVNYLSLGAYFNGVTIADVSDKYMTLFTPAPITFAVWSFIYLGLFMYVFWQIKTLLYSQYVKAVDGVVEKIGLLFLLTCVFNSLWIVAWHYDKLLYSVIIMTAQLWTLVKINRRISLQLPATPQYKLFLKMPFGIYLGDRKSVV